VVNIGSLWAAMGRRVIPCALALVAALAVSQPALAQNAVNTATITAPAGVTDPTPANNTATDSDPVVRTANLSVSKTDGIASIAPSGTTTYTIVVSNAGPSEVTAATVVDNAPAGLTINTWSCAVTNPGTGGVVTTACGVAGGIGNINTTVDMKNGAAITYTVNATVSASATGSISNTVAVAPPAGTTDPGPDGNNATDTNTVTPTADIAVQKTLTTTGPYVVGQAVTYSIVVTNNGPSAATNVGVSDTPTNLAINSVSGACAALPCTIASIISGASATITVNGTVGNTVGAFNNSATATLPAGTTDPTPGNNIDDAPATAAASADVSITKTPTTVGPYFAGQTITYSIVVNNAGPSAAQNVVVDDQTSTLSNVVLSSATPGCAATQCVFATVASGATINITATATITAAGAFNNLARVAATTFDPNVANNQDNAGNGGNAGASSDVSIVKTLTTAGPYTVGQTVSFDILVSNAGPSTATNVGIADVPNNLTLGTVTGACTALPCTIASIASGANATITVQGTILADGAFGNSATATLPPGTIDPNPGNNTGTDGDNTTPTADISIVKTLTTAGPYTIGQTVSFDILVSNAGPSAATNIGIADLPNNLTLGTVTGACTALPCTIASIASGANATITVQGVILADGAFGNSATATLPPGTTDPNPGNNTGTDGDTTTPTADVSIVKTLTTAGPYTIGQTVSFDILVSNAGPSAATNIGVADVPTNLTLGTVTGACTALPCTIASIASGANATITVQGTILTDGAFGNSATATLPPGTTDPNPGNNTGTDGDNTTPTADVSIVKTLTTAGPYTIGQAVSFDILVSNAGPSTATNIGIADVPTNLALGAVTGACTALPCTIASIASGTNVTITVAGTILADGAFGNSATATLPPGTTDPNPGNNTGTDGDNTTPTADVSIVKTLTTAGPYTIGQTVSFDILVSNTGPSSATNIGIADVPANLALGTITGACTALPCTIASIASGANATITVAGTILADGAFGNSATATLPPGTTDPNPGNNTGTDGDNTTSTADVSIVKTLTTAGPYTIGQTVSFDILVSNAGPSAATNVGIADVPTNLTLGTVTGACTALPCTIASIASGANVTITVQGTILADGAFGNSATATLPPGTTDPNPGNNTGTDGDNTTPTADVSIVKTLTTAGPYTIGQTVSFDILVSNAGPSAATNIGIADVPTNLALGTVTGACTALPCTIASIASGANATITVQGTILADGAFGNSATATLPPGTTDPNPGNNTGTDGDNTTPTADVSIVKTLTTAGPYTIGQTVSFDILVSNAGPSTATNIGIADVPNNLTLGAVTGACTALPCTIASIASGANATITVQGTILADGAFGNSATATLPPGTTDPNPGNNTGTDGDNTTPTADVAVQKSLSTIGPILAGQSIQYSIVVTNNGPSVATNVQVSDTPTNITITNVAGGCSALPCTIASIAAGTNVAITVTATVGAAGGAFNNSASATATQTDPTSGNNTDDAPGTAGALPIVANDDAFGPVNGAAGGNTASVLGNDTLNGNPAILANVTLAAGISPNPGLTMNADGTITIAPGTATGAYVYPYTICEQLNPANCDTANATVNVAAALIDAVADTFGPVNGAVGGNTASVLVNDTLNGNPATLANVTLAAGVSPNPGLTMNADGTIAIAPGTAAGTYVYPYTICEQLNPANCDTANATVTVAAAPIVANDDAAPAPANGSTGGVAIVNIFGNDTLDGAPLVRADVAVTNTAVPPQLTFDAGTGQISVVPGSAAGTYTFDYTICELLNPSNCDTATISVDVSAAVIDAVADMFGPVNGATGANTASVLGNDTLNGNPATLANVNLAPGASPNPGLAMNADGTITIAPGTAAGTYVYPYTICEVLNPSNCDTANATVDVAAAVIDAVADTFGPVNGATGGNTASVLANDTLNGNPVTPATVTLTPGVSPNPGLVMNANGTITIAPGTAAGTYVYPYTICEQLNPANCDTANATVDVAAAVIDAVADTFGPVNGATGGNTVSVLVNDILNGNPATLANVTLAPGASPNPGLTMNANGTITIASGTAAGTYVYPYTICEQLNPANCDTANATVTVQAAPIVANDDGFGPINGAAGGNTASVLANDTLNGTPATPATVALTPGVSPNPGLVMNADGTITIASGTAAGTYIYPYTICEQLNPANCDTANATVNVAAALIDAVADTFGPVNGAAGGNTASVLVNDTLNGNPAALANVSLAPGVSPNPGLTMNANGTITIAPGTAAGTYIYPYTICEQLNPANCDTANATVTVTAAAIVANDDTAPAPINGSTGGAAIANTFGNDTLNVASLVRADVTVTNTPVPAQLTFDAATGQVSVVAGSAAGTYSFDYTICEVLNPSNCDTATVSVDVAAAAIDAVADTFGPVNGAAGGSTASVLGNDTLNGNPVTNATVTLAAGASPNPGLTMTAGGTITIAPGTAAGTYVYPYTICEQLNPANCDTANATVTVSAAPIVANDDSFGPVNGATGGNTASVLGNDTLNGTPATNATVTLAPGASPNPGLAMNADGTVTIAPGTAAGAYVYPYTICEQLNPANCDTANATVTVSAAPIVANDDSFGPVNGASGGATASVRGNDTLNGTSVTNATVTQAPGVSPNPGLTMNADGTITIAPGTAAATYVYPYTICEVLNPSNCDTAAATVVVSAAPVAASADSASTPQNTPVTISVLGNDSLNGAAVDPTQVTVTQASAPANGSIVINPDGSIAYTPNAGYSGTDTFTYQICENLNPANCATATVTVTVQANTVTATNDTATTPANKPVSITVLNDDTSTGAPLDPGSVTITVQPGNGTVTVNADGTIVYTPNPNYLGNDTFTYQVCDTSIPTAVCDSAVVSIAVSGSPPVTGPNGDSAQGPAGQPVTIPVLANDSDPDNNIDPASVVIVGAPGNGKSLVVAGQGTWTVNPNGTITFTPEPGFVGEATPIQYTVSDTTGLVSNPSSVNVTILGDVSLRITKTASPRDVKIGDLVRYTVTIENVGAANANDATLIDTPPAGFSYVDNSLKVADQDGAARLVGTYPIRVDQLDIAIGERATVTYLLRVGAGVRPGTHTNRAYAQDGGATVSNEATADVQLIADPMLDESLLVGTVFDDRDGDGWQDTARLDGVRVQGGFAPSAYVADSTIVGSGAGAKPAADASAPLLHGLDIGEIAGRQSEADPASAHAVTISQTLVSLDFADDFALTSKQGVTVRMDAAGNTRVERGGDAAKGLTGAAPNVTRRVSQVEGGYRVDYIVSNEGIDEHGIPGVRIASVEGLLIETDQYGRYHLEGVQGGPWERGRNFILKVDPATLPPGSVFTTDNPLVRRITPGLPVRFDFGVKLPSGLVEGGRQDLEMELGEVMFDAESATLRKEYLPVVDKMAEQVRQHDGGEVIIAATGESQALAYDRAKAVRDALLGKLSPEQAQALKVSLRADPENADSALATLGESTVLGTVLFDTDKAAIKPEYAPLIEKIAADVGRLGGGVIGVVGHADRRGSDTYNVQLGLRRAKAVYDAIAARLTPEVRARLRREISDNPTAPVGTRGRRGN